MTIQALPRKKIARKKAPAGRAKAFRPAVPFNDTYRNGKRDSGGKTVFEILDEREAKAGRASAAKQSSKN